MTELFAVVGKPALHSKSPDMHNAAFYSLGIDAIYARIAAESVQEALELATSIGISGMNVTAPFKEEMAKLVDLNEDARKAGAVNTVLIRGGKMIGYNTDIRGVVGALSAGIRKIKLQGKKTVVLGAGGAAKAATVALLSMRAKVTVVNRTVEKAEEIAKRFGCDYAPLSELKEVLDEARVVVSTISTSERVIPPKLLRKEMAVLDANYADASTLLEDAKAKGCKVIDGKEWLLHQGFAAFELFTGKKAPIEVMRKALSARITSRKKQNSKLETGNIALIGMMGSGKSVVAHAISKVTQMQLFDIDREIENKTKITIKEIFKRDGEEKFRRLEREEIAKLKTQNIQNHVISCGGGAILDPKNRKTIKENTIVVWLWANPKTIVARVKGDQNRPLLNVPDSEKANVIARLLEGRRRFYAETADIIIDTTAKTPEQVAERILYEIHKTR